MRHHYDEIEIKANGVDHAVVGKASLEATLHTIDLTEASWLIRPDAKLPVGKLESRIIIDSAHLGRFIGIKDLMVEAPAKDTNDATGGTTESGISGSKGLVFTGTPRAAGFDKRVSVTVDLSITGADADDAGVHRDRRAHRSRHRRPGVPEEKKAAVLAAFSGSLPGQKLPFGVRPTTEGARGSDIIIEGITEGVTIAPRRVQTVMTPALITAIAAIAAALGVAAIVGVLHNRRSGVLRDTVTAGCRRLDTSDLGLSRTGPTIVHFSADLVRAVRRRAPGGRPGVRRPAGGRPRRDRHGRQSGCRAQAFGAVAADDVHLRRRRPAAVPDIGGAQGR